MAGKSTPGIRVQLIPENCILNRGWIIAALWPCVSAYHSPRIGPVAITLREIRALEAVTPPETLSDDDSADFYVWFEGPNREWYSDTFVSKQL